jgi:hypothetical protein
MHSNRIDYKTTREQMAKSSKNSSEKMNLFQDELLRERQISTVSSPTIFAISFFFRPK